MLRSLLEVPVHVEHQVQEAGPAKFCTARVPVPDEESRNRALLVRVWPALKFTDEELEAWAFSALRG
jgi:hypothetical protein